jgi:DnaJ-class molecular chaperone
MLKLVGELELTPCPACNGTGRVIGTRTLTRQGMDTPGEFSPRPCPVCSGAKVVDLSNVQAPTIEAKPNTSDPIAEYLSNFSTRID